MLRVNRRSARTAASDPARKIVCIPAGTVPTSNAMAMVLSELMHATLLTKERRRGHYVPMPSGLLQKLAGPRYTETLRECKERGYIEPNDRYSTLHGFCKSYRLRAPYRTGRWAEYRLTRSRGGNDRIRIDETNETDVRLVQWMREARIPHDVAADGWAQYAVHSIVRGDLYATRCDYGRFHSTFTALPKNIRRELHLHDRPVAEKDVANCQPIFLGLLAAEHYGIRAQRLGRPSLHHISILTHTGGASGATVESVQRYLECCGAGRLYETLLERATARGMRYHDFIFDPRKRHLARPNRDLTRQDIKDQYNVMVFAKTSQSLKMPLFGIFADEFPGVAEYGIAAKANGHKALARDCQRLESSVMIDGAASTLSRRFPVLTVHDSFIVPEDRAGEATREIESQFARLGVSVKVN